MTRAVCVSDPGGHSDTLLERLEIAERTLGSLRIVGLPQPPRRLDRGVVWLEDSDEGTSPCEREARIARAVVTSSVASTGAETSTSGVLSEAFAALMSPCRAEPAVDPGPEHGYPGNGARLLSWLDRELGAAGPGRYLAAVTTRFPGADLFAVLRENTKDAFFSGSTFGDAVAAFGLLQVLPPRKPTWDVEWPTKPRALALPTPLAPLGSAAVRLRVPPGRAASPTLRIEAAWEQHADLRLAVVAVNDAGAELQKAWIPGRARVPEASFTFQEVPGARAILIVLTSLGDPFSPLDDRALGLEPHGAIVTVAELD